MFSCKGQQAAYHCLLMVFWMERIKPVWKFQDSELILLFSSYVFIGHNQAVPHGEYCGPIKPYATLYSIMWYSVIQIPFTSSDSGHTHFCVNCFMSDWLTCLIVTFSVSKWSTLGFYMLCINMHVCVYTCLRIFIDFWWGCDY